MKCQDIDTLLNNHETLSLSAARQAEADAHLACCARCAQVWRIHGLLRDETPAAPRTGLFGETLAGIEAGAYAAGDAARGRRRVLLAGYAAAASLVLAVVLGAMVARDGTDITPPIVIGQTEAVVETAPPPPDPETDRAVAGAGNTTTAIGTSPLTTPRSGIGRRYETLGFAPLPAAESERIEVCEFFQYDCWHCYSVEDDVTAWAAERSQAIDLVRVPAVFNAGSELQARIFYTAKTLGILDRFHGAYLREIHERGQRLVSLTDLADLFARFGVDEATFQQAYDSPQVAAEVQRAADLTRRYRVTATPSLVVSGRYVTSTGMVASTRQWFEIADALVVLSRAERALQRVVEAQSRAAAESESAGDATGAAAMERILERVQQGWGERRAPDNQTGADTRSGPEQREAETDRLSNSRPF